jgi:hypothetical protein
VLRQADRDHLHDRDGRQQMGDRELQSDRSDSDLGRPGHLWRGPEDFTATPLQSLIEQIEAGTMRVTIGRTFKLEQIVEAHRASKKTQLPARSFLA